MRKINVKRFLSPMLALIVLLNSISISYAEQNKDQKASETTKQKILKTANDLLSRKELTDRFLGTVYLHGQTEQYGYITGSDESMIPKDAIESTAWFNVWQTAAESKVLIDTYTEKLAENKLNELAYYETLYGFEMSNSLKKDGFYKGDFKTYEMRMIGGEPVHQAFYEKVKEQPSFRNLFSGMAIFKSGNDIEINFAIDKQKVKSIEGISFNSIATIKPPVKIGSVEGERNLFLVKVPGELKAENLVVSQMIYIDAQGKEQKTGAFGIEINYNELVFDKNYKLPNQDANVQRRIEAWMNRGNILLNGFLSDPQKIDDVKKAIRELEELKSQKEADLGQVYKIVRPIHMIENEFTLQDVLNSKILTHRESLQEGFYSEKVYTKESLQKYENLLEEYDRTKTKKNLSELVEMTATIDKSTLNTVLKFNIEPLKKLIAIAESKNINEYRDETLAAFLSAKLGAKQWVEKMESYSPTINETGDCIDTLLKAINNLVRKDGKSEPKINKNDLFTQKDEGEVLEKEQIYTVEGEYKDYYNPKKVSEFAPMFNTKIKLIENNKKGARIELTIKPLKDQKENVLKAITEIQYNKKGRLTVAKVLKSKEIEILNKLDQPIPIKTVEKVELENIDLQKMDPMVLDLKFYDKEQGRTISRNVLLSIDFYNKKEGFTEEDGSVPQQNPKEYTVDVKFLQAKDISKESHANSTLVQRAKLEVQGDKQTLTLKLKPMVNSEGIVSGVLTDLFYYNELEKIATSKLEQKKIKIEYQGKSKEYTYPTAVSMPVDGKTEQIKCHMISGTPVFDEPHGDDVILWVNYKDKSEGYNENEVDKRMLSQLIVLLEGPYYRSIRNIVPRSIYDAMTQEVSKARLVLKNIMAKEHDVQEAVEALRKVKEKIDFYINLDNEYRDIEANWKSDEKNKNFSQESKDKARKFIEDKKREIEAYMIRDNFSLELVREMISQLRDYHYLLRYDVYELEKKIKEAEEKIASRKYEEKGIQELQKILAAAKEYVKSAKETKRISDERANYITKLDDIIKKLVEKAQPPKIDTDALSQKIAEAQEKIDSKKYTEDTVAKLSVIIQEASAFIEDVKAGRATEDKSDMLIQKLTQGIQELKEKQVPPSDEVIVGMLDALLVKPDGSGNSMANAFMDKKVKVSYNKTKDQTVYEMAFNVTGLASSDMISDSTAALTTEINAAAEEQVDKTLDMAEPKALIVEGAETNSDDMMSAEELPITESSETTTESAAMERAEEVAVIPTADTTKKVLEFWYKEGDDFKKIDDVEATAGKMTFRFMRSGKVAELTEMKVHIAAFNMTHEVNLKLTIPSDFYGNADEKIKQAKEALQQSIERAQNIKEQDHEKDSYTKMSKALEEAKTLIQKSDAKEQELKDAKAKLDEAIQGLKKKDDSAEKIKQAKEALQESIERAQSIKEQDHEKDSYAKMSKALEDAKALIRKSDAKEQELKDAKAKLDEAIQSLKKKDDSAEKIKQAKEALQQSIERAQSIKEQDHEKDSYAKMSKALEDAKALIRKSDAKEQELKDAKAKLDEAIQGLKKKNVPGGSGAPGGGGSSSNNSNQRPNTEKKPETIQPNEVPLANTESTLSILSIGSRLYTVTQNGNTENRMMDVAPMIVQGRTMLPIRVVSELLGVKVHYDHNTKIATFVYKVEEQENKIELFIQKSMMKVNGMEQKLSATPTNSKGRILIPLKDLQSAMKELGLHSDISWNADAKQVTIKKG